MDILHHFVCEIYSNAEIKVEYLETRNMKADILTKPLNTYKRKKGCDLI